MGDDMYPNDGEWFATPEHLIQERNDEKRKLGQAKPLIQELINRMDDRISFYKDIDSIPVDLTDEPSIHAQYVEAHRKIRNILEDEKNYFMTMLDQREV